MKVGVLGTGDVGKALGNAFITLGHDVMMGAREPGNPKAAAWVQAMGAKARAGTFADAAAFADLVVVATLGTANEAVIGAAGAERLAGKVVWDTTNPLDFSSGLPRLATVGAPSSGEEIQALAPAARVVKVFNTVGNALMFRPVLAGGPPTMFLCGNDNAAKAETTALLKDFGWDALDAGGIDMAHHLEAMCLVWVRTAMKTGHWAQAFRMLR